MKELTNLQLVFFKYLLLVGWLKKQIENPGQADYMHYTHLLKDLFVGS